jgi:Tfp pilus assembly protein PilW
MTLVELMVATSLGALIMTGILTVFLFIGRTSANMSSYVDLESQARESLELFAQDARQASSITYSSTSTAITLTVNSIPITYGHDAATAQFYRTIGTGTPTTLLTGITAFSFIGYKLDGTQVNLSNTALAGINTKQIQISLKAQRVNNTAAAISNTVLSARYILRNKVTTT